MAESPISHDSPLSMSIVRAWLPHPWTTVALMLLWLALANSFSYGNMLIALVMAVAIPIYTSHFWPEATVALASIISLTPGTISSDFSNDKRFLLVHCLDLDHEESLVASIKNRYEKRLRRIFG
jgi:multisubunit Na+/H+ antiporter MnhE subunit